MALILYDKEKYKNVWVDRSSERSSAVTSSEVKSDWPAFTGQV